ncbi:hypothetical protein [Flagellimonas sp. CMM7]|uniref:hypothetical protein n=1 Tax=Flagellimonas sp. CMM7 TaxID=2654676 RepID=UPI0013D0D95D|nr:hypothetical protein [Flagellimonas sp. CMM7]UII80038.1 hypothetical protein LV704_00605 [Flagellimonas sp. CMM7]
MKELWIVPLAIDIAGQGKQMGDFKKNNDMKTVEEQLTEQISGRCIHFTGIANNTCELGISYKDVRDETQRPYKFPCLKRHHGGDCSNAQFPTKEDLKREVDEIIENQKKTVNAMVMVKEHIAKTGEKIGSIECPCSEREGRLEYSMAEINGHVRSSCTTCKMGWIE